MTPTPLPTPYDIVDIPYFPYIPGLVAWLLFLATAAIVIFSLKRAASRKARRQVKAYELALRQIEAAAKSAESSPKDGCAVASLVAKRFVSACEGEDMLALSAAEIARRLESCPDRELRLLLETLVELDTYRYRQAGAQLGGREIINLLRERLSAYHTAALRREK